MENYRNSNYQEKAIADKFILTVREKDSGNIFGTVIMSGTVIEPLVSAKLTYEKQNHDAVADGEQTELEYQIFEKK